MKNSPRLKLLATILPIDLVLTIVVTLAYFPAMHVQDRGFVLGNLIGWHVLRMAAWMGLFWWMLGPLERWVRDRDDDALEEANRAFLRITFVGPLVFAALYALTYPAVTLLRYYAGSEANLAQVVPIAAGVMGLAFLAGGLTFIAPAIKLLLSGVAEELFLAARRRGMVLPRRTGSLTGLIGGVAVGLVITVSFWLTGMSIAHDGESNQRWARTHARRIAEHASARIAREGTAADLKPLLDMNVENTSVFVADRSGALLTWAGAEASAELRRELEDLLAAAPTGLVEPSRDHWLAWVEPQGGRLVGVLEQKAFYSSAEFMTELGLFLLLVVVFTPLAAVVVALSVAAPIRRVGDAAQRIVEVGDLSKHEAVPLVDRNEAGRLAERFNELLDQLRGLALGAHEVAQGRLDVEVEGRGELPEAFRSMVGNLAGMVEQIRNASAELAGAAAEIYASSQEQETAATSQSSGMMEISQTMESLADAAGHVSRSADGVYENAEHSRANTDQMIARIGELTGHAGRIGQLLDVIREVADRSDLLALNGSLEATRAGEAGRGFGLVAAEMRRLAERVTASVQDVKQLVDDIHASGSATVMATEDSRKLAEGTSDAAQQITMAVQQQRSATEQVTQSVKDIADLVSQAAVATTQVRASAENLKQMADGLSEQVRRFETRSTPQPSEDGQASREAAA